MKCHCKGSLIQKSASGGLDLRIKGKVTVDDAGLHAQCFWCGDAVTLPLELKKGVPVVQAERLIIPAKKR
jgi:hypothetical protein